jgi:hypothetical protein
MQDLDDVDIGVWLQIAENYIRDKVPMVDDVLQNITGPKIDIRFSDYFYSPRRRLPSGESLSLEQLEALTIKLAGFDWNFLGHNWAYATPVQVGAEEFGQHEILNKQITVKSYFAAAVCSSLILGKSGIKTESMVVLAGILLTFLMSYQHNYRAFAEAEDPESDIGVHDRFIAKWFKKNGKSMLSGFSIVNSTLSAFVVGEYIIGGKWKTFKWYWFFPLLFGVLGVAQDWSTMITGMISRNTRNEGGVEIHHFAHLLGELNGLLMAYLL